MTYILGLASAFPSNWYSQDTMRDRYLLNNPSSDPDFVDRVFKATEIEGCYSSLSEDRLFRRMGREEYIIHVKDTMRDIGTKAATKAITEWNGPISDITHLVWGTMTGCIHAPDMTVDMIHRLGLPMTTQRVNIENMGCLTGYRALSLATDIAKGNPQARVLVIVADIRNALGNLMTQDDGHMDKSNVITAALFRDAAGACIVGGSPKEDEVPIYQVKDHRSLLIPDTYNYVKYTEKDTQSVHLAISRDLPDMVAKMVPTLMPMPDTYDIACHTGGPKVLKCVRDALGTSDDRMKASWYVMHRYGNLSGASNLVVLDHNRKEAINPHPQNDILCLSMGPGIGVEALWVSRV